MRHVARSLLKRAMGAGKWARHIARKNSLYDLDRFEKASTMYSHARDAEMAGARIVMDCHRLEKGLALAAPKPGFGRDVIARLLHDVPEYERRFGPGLPSITAREALLEYEAFNDGCGQAIAPELKAFNRDRSAAEDVVAAGTIEVSREDLQPAPGMDFERFAQSRFSIRNYTGEPVSIDAIERAVAIAQKTPSVCNRQSARVHVALGRDAISKALGWQNGNRGFGESVGALIIVTSDMRIFKDIGERNQCWVDGGMFAMSLCYALHGQGLGTCMLNWSQPMHVDQSMRRALGIPDNEAVITMLAVGHIPPKLRVAISPRRPTGSILRTVA